MRQRDRLIVAAATLMAGLYLPATSFGATDFALTASNCTGSDEGNLDGTNGNVRSCTGSNGTTVVNLTAWSSSADVANLDDDIETAFLGIYSGGVGATGNDDGDGSSNQHTLDNFGDTEASGDVDGILIEFPGLWALTTVVAGLVVNDGDMSVLRYTGAGVPASPAGQTWAELITSNAWELVAHLTTTSSSEPQTFTSFNALLETSTHWFITAANPSSFGTAPGCLSAQCDGNADKVKINSITGVQPDVGVPEPATLLLFAIALFGIIAQRAHAKMVVQPRGVPQA